MMSDKELDERIKAANEEFVTGEDINPLREDEEQTSLSGLDLYQERTKKSREEAKKIRPRGSSTIVLAVTQAAIDGDGVPESGLGYAYKIAECEANGLKERGEKVRADIVRQQYMEEHFLPAVETVVRFSSPDELLNCKEALRTLDKYVLGTGDKKGYTASYIRSAYERQLGQDLNARFGQSDPTVIGMVRRIRALSAKDEIRAAIGLAKQIKRAIDDGDNMASDADYELIGRVAAYGD